MQKSQTPLLNFEDRGRITVATIVSTNMLDGANVPDFGKEILAFVSEHPNANILLNFQNVIYMSSAALTELLRVNQVLREGGGSVRLCGLTDTIRNVFEITNLEKLFMIHDDDDVEGAFRRFDRALSIAAEEQAWSKRNSDA